MHQGTTITSEGYCKTLRKLHRAIQNKKRGMLTSGVVLLQDLARPYTAAHTQALLYSPDLALSKLPPVYLPEELVGITVLQQ
jgi:hypothetical protein